MKCPPYKGIYLQGVQLLKVPFYVKEPKRNTSNLAFKQFKTKNTGENQQADMNNRG